MMKDKTYSEPFDEEMFDLLSTTFQLPDNFSATVITVGPNEVARPDIISKILYGDEMYSDLILKINGIGNAYELNEGMKLVVPSVADLERFVVRPSKIWKEDRIGGNLSPLYISGDDVTLGKEAAITADDSVTVVRRASDESSITNNHILNKIPVQKTKKQTRKPNESMLGDKRYSIKGSENVVIY